MKHIFYFIGIIFAIKELIWILDPKNRTEKNKKFFEQYKNNKGKKWDDMTEVYKGLLITKGLPSLFITLWLFIGLLTFNWLPFLAILLYNFIIIAPISKALRFNVGYTILHWLNSVVGFVFSVFIIINSYHLKINIYAWFIQWLNI